MSTNSSRATVITKHLNNKFFTDKRIANLADVTEDAITLLNGLKNAADAISIMRDQTSDVRKALMHAVENQDRDAVEKLEANLIHLLSSINDNKFLKDVVAFGRAVRAKKLDADVLVDLEFADVADDFSSSKKSK